MRRLAIATLLVLAACGGPTEPHAPKTCHAWNTTGVVFFPCDSVRK
jgi:hypothetical protein